MTIVVYPFGPEIHLPVLGTIHLVIARFDVALLYVLIMCPYDICHTHWQSFARRVFADRSEHVALLDGCS